MPHLSRAPGSTALLAALIGGCTLGSPPVLLQTEEVFGPANTPLTMRWVEAGNPGMAELQVKGQDGEWHTCGAFYDYSNVEAQMQRMLQEALKEQIRILSVVNSCFEAWEATRLVPGRVERDSGGGGGGNNNNR